MRYITNLPMALGDYKKYNKEHYLKTWKNEWNNEMETYKHKNYDPGSFANYFNLQRRDQICVTRLILRTCRFTHQHFFKKEEISICPECNNPSTLAHLIMLCPALEQHRKALREYCNNERIKFCMQNILNCEFPTELL